MKRDTSGRVENNNIAIVGGKNERERHLIDNQLVVLFVYLFVLICHFFRSHCQKGTRGAARLRTAKVAPLFGASKCARGETGPRLERLHFHLVIMSNLQSLSKFKRPFR